ncbi:hypothetical protein N780_08410 [Pontibacillus chungwhensis BH030062]|uniref:DUF2922 domain-containing protein n=2 Tax=Pontibacillus TaxID=289201 RepID=A0A0A2UTI1_9BACI|nr:MULTISPECIES: DUF2922 domain-containing protein [Pontibacillus]KGP91229.1 hypothetical protein N780_08410 [Pontibacillus chungwhensis BH030062]QST01021.1 DUF2922 domain-containing protein [Pontibacillus sp. ALD_SL1]GGD08578.1 potassium channel protein [Pontibacillus salipaludis]
MAKKLEMKFENQDGRTVTISLDDPIEPVDVVALNAAMDEIVTQNCFTSSGGDLVSKKEARIVERNVADIEL